MDCEQAREELIELIDQGRQDWRDELVSHLDGCPSCRTWYEQQQQAIAALAQLQPLPVPAGLKARILAQLPALPGAALARKPKPVARENRLEGLLRSLAGLTRPAARQRLVPALVLAASLLLVGGVLYLMQGGQPAVTPGAATGGAGWVAAGGLALVAVVLAIALVVLRRRL